MSIRIFVFFKLGVVAFVFAALIAVALVFLAVGILFVFVFDD